MNQRGNSDDTKPEKKKQRVEEPAADDDSEDEVVGPFLPGHEPTRRGVKAGPTAPTLQDLDLQRGVFPPHKPFLVSWLTAQSKQRLMRPSPMLTSVPTVSWIEKRSF